MEKYPVTDRTKITRLPARGSYDKEVIWNILKEGLVCHVSIVEQGVPYILPNLYGITSDKIFIHGSVGSFLQRSLLKSIDLCFSVTLIDGLVLARSAFNHSVNYRSVIVFGKATAVTDEEEKMKALEVLTEHIVPGRWKDVRLPNPSEMKKTMVLSIPLSEASAKIRNGPVGDEEEDYDLKTWAGILPLRMETGIPVTDEKMKFDLEVPEYIKNYDRKKNQ